MARSNLTKQLKAELKWAWQHLQYEVPIPDTETEFGECVVCGKRDFEHAPNCEALKHRDVVKLLLTQGKN